MVFRLRLYFIVPYNNAYRLYVISSKYHLTLTHMPRLLFLMLFQLISCNHSGEAEHLPPPKDYTLTHEDALKFIKTKGYSDAYYFLIDLNVHSGKNRFFVYDFQQKKIIQQNLVTHGMCDKFEKNPEKHKKVKFSNRVDSHCSSSGKYKVGKRGYSSWGINVKYWLEGLEETNDNARERVVVLHSWDAVANEEIYPDYSPLSWGCPAVSDKFMKVLDEKLQKTSKPVLLWIIN